MFKSVVQSRIIIRANLRICEYSKYVQFLSPKPWFLYITSDNSNVYSKHPVCRPRPISLRHFVTNGPNFSQPGTKLNSTISTIKDDNSQSENSEIPVETVQNNTPDLFDNIDFDEITGGDEENLNKFKLLLLEVDVMRQDGMKVPRSMSTDRWKELFTLKSRAQRLKFLNFLWKVEIKKLSDKRKKEEKKVKLLEKRALEDIENSSNEHIKYGFHGSTIFLRVYETTMNIHHNNKLIQAMKFGQNIVLDCGYESDMSPMENKLCAKQLGILFADNRKNKDPFNLHFCNMKRDSLLFKQFKKLIPTVDDPTFPINLTEDHYLNLFPKEKLVYLTPHCRTELLHFNHDDIYIVGALVDKQKADPLSLAKAKSEGIRMARFPLDRYLHWAIGTKSLTINQVITILLDIRTTGDWNSALKYVPKRKVHQPGEPIQDTRQFYRRGTTFQPPSKYDRRNKKFDF